MRLQVSEWYKYIKLKSWSFPDQISFGQVNHLIDVLNSISNLKVPKIESQSSQSLPMGFHFLFNNQSNNNLGRDWYDNYQSPYSIKTNKPLFARRMWVKGVIVNRNAFPNVGDKINCQESISSVRYLAGSAFVNIQRQFYKEDNLSFEESRTLIYTNEKFTLNRPKVAIDTTDDTTTTIKISAQDVLKYSMLTYNLHKIHYDKHYCQQIESLPDVIVSGPFMVTLLLHWFSNIKNIPSFKSFSYKNIEPCFVEQSTKLCCGQIDNNKFKLKITNETTTRVFIEGTITV